VILAAAIDDRYRLGDAGGTSGRSESARATRSESDSHGDDRRRTRAPSGAGRDMPEIPAMFPLPRERFPAPHGRSGPVTPIPEPGSMLLFGAGAALVGLVALRKRSRSVAVATERRSG